MNTTKHTTAEGAGSSVYDYVSRARRAHFDGMVARSCGATAYAAENFRYRDEMMQAAHGASTIVLTLPAKPEEQWEAARVANAPKSDEDESAPLYYGYFDGLRGNGIEMTMEQAESASDASALARIPSITMQLDLYGPMELAISLRESGAWDEAELEDDDQNRQRAVWLAACDIRENRSEV